MIRLAEKYIFPVSVLSITLSFFFSWSLLSVLIFALALYYIASGWYVLNPEQPMKFRFCYFLLGYSYATTLVASMFNQRDFPMADDLAIVSIIVLLIGLIAIAFRFKPTIKIYIKSSIILLLSLLLLII